MEDDEQAIEDSPERARGLIGHRAASAQGEMRTVKRKRATYGT